jgi:hypothetical protein
MRIVSDKSMFIYSGLVLVLTFILFKDTTLSGQEKFVLGILFYSIFLSAYMLFTQSESSYTYMMPRLLQHFFGISAFLMSFALGPLIIYEILCEEHRYCKNVIPKAIDEFYYSIELTYNGAIIFLIIVVALSILARFIESRLEKKRSKKWEKERREKDFY